MLIVADDLGLHTGAYGDPQARTPNLDALAGDGIRFTHGFCTTASCSASRSVLFTGLHNHANGQFGHAHSYHHMSLHANIVPIPRLLKDAGYRTGLVGKFHVAPPSAFAWDHLGEGGDRNVSRMAAEVRKFVEESKGRPWHLHIGFGDPHRAARGFANDRSYPGVTDEKFDPARIDVPAFLPGTPAVRAELAEYYQAANRMDQGIGMLMRALRETGELDNTLVIFLSDNGIPFPNAKTNLYDAGARLPLIVRAPAQKRRGVVNNAMVSWTDIAPTLLDFAGVKGPVYPLHGRSFLPVLEEERPAGWDEVYFSHTFHEITMYYPMRGIRTRRYKYLNNLAHPLEYPHASDLWASATWKAAKETGMVGKRKVSDYLHRPAEELYDLDADPDEVKNLAPSPAHRATLEELRKKTWAFRERTKDPWLILERERDARFNTA